MYVINEKTKVVDVWADTEINNQRLASGKYGVVLYTGEVEEVDGVLYAKGFTPVKPLEEVKAEKITEINTARDNAEQSGFEFKGNIYDSDTLSAQRLSMASQTAATSLTAGQSFEITWTTQDNKQVVLSAQDMIEIVPALAMHSNTQHQKASVLKEQVTNATTVEEVESIVWG